jgi:hypothetical protein
MLSDTAIDVNPPKPSNRKPHAYVVDIRAILKDYFANRPLAVPIKLESPSRSVEYVTNSFKKL